MIKLITHDLRKKDVHETNTLHKSEDWYVSKLNENFQKLFWHTSTKHLDLIRSIQNPFSTIVPVRDRSSLIWFKVNGRTKFLIRRIFVGFVAGGLGDFTCGTSLTIDILRLAAINHNLTNKYIKYFIFVTFYLKKKKKNIKKDKKAWSFTNISLHYTSNYKYNS